MMERKKRGSGVFAGRAIACLCVGRRVERRQAVRISGRGRMQGAWGREESGPLLTESREETGFGFMHARRIPLS